MGGRGGALQRDPAEAVGEAGRPQSNPGCNRLQSLRDTAAERGLVFVDYGEVLADAEGGLRSQLSNDGVHPTRAGYAAMRPLAERAIAAAERTH